MATAVNFDDKFRQFSEQWQPHIIARMNDYEFKVARLEGEFVWHQHDNTDEAFIVLDGTLRIELPDDDAVVLRPGDMYVVPRGVQHRPVTEGGEVRLLLIEPCGTANTGDDATGERTREAATI